MLSEHGANPLLSPEENNHLATIRQGSNDRADHAAETLTAFLARVDWNRVFIVTARVLVSIGLLMTAYQYFQYTLFFGAGALAFIGQFLIGVFFAAVVLYSREGLPIITATAGMYLLTSSF